MVVVTVKVPADCWGDAPVALMVALLDCETAAVLATMKVPMGDHLVALSVTDQTVAMAML